MFTKMYTHSVYQGIPFVFAQKNVVNFFYSITSIKPPNFNFLETNIHSCSYIKNAID